MGVLRTLNIDASFGRHKRSRPFLYLVALLDGKSLRAHDFCGGDWRLLDLVNERVNVEGTRITYPQSEGSHCAKRA